MDHRAQIWVDRNDVILDLLETLSTQARIKRFFLLDKFEISVLGKMVFKGTGLGIVWT